MSKIRNLTQILGAEVVGTDLMHLIDASETVGDRRITIDELKIALGLSQLETKFLQYSNAALQTNSTTTYADLTMVNDQSSDPGALFTKSSASQFKANFTGFVKVFFKVNGFTDTNDRSGIVQIAKNGSGLVHTRSQFYGKNQTERTSASSGSAIIAVVPNDYITIQFASAEAGPVATVPIGGAMAYVESYIVTSVP